MAKANAKVKAAMRLLRMSLMLEGRARAGARKKFRFIERWTLGVKRWAFSYSAMKIDLHTHILPHDWPDLDARYGYSGFIRLDHYKPCCARMMKGGKVFREITDNTWDPKRRIEDMDRTGVTMQV